MLARLLRRRRPAHAPAVEALLRQTARLRTDAFVRAGYQQLLGRSPDQGGFDEFRRQIDAGRMSRGEFLERLLGSAEYRRAHGLPPGSELEALHDSRLQMIRQLPPAEAIVDLGGACEGRPEGALVALGYPHRFRTLTIVEPPRPQRHAIYLDVCDDRAEPVRTPRGEVRYLFRSMADLGPIESGSVDLVFSGESVEHVTRAEIEQVFAEVRRVLRPGGSFCFDTPNRRLTRLQVGEGFINPDHKYEYTHAEMAELLTRHGFAVVSARGLNRMSESARTGTFRGEEMIGHVGLFDEVEDCYLLYYHARV